MTGKTVTWSLEEFLQAPRVQQGNGGRLLADGDAFEASVVRPQTPLDETTAAVKIILKAEARERSEKTARLTAARQARKSDAG